MLATPVNARPARPVFARCRRSGLPRHRSGLVPDARARRILERGERAPPAGSRPAPGRRRSPAPTSAPPRSVHVPTTGRPGEPGRQLPAVADLNDRVDSQRLRMLLPDLLLRADPDRGWRCSRPAASRGRCPSSTGRAAALDARTARRRRRVRRARRDHRRDLGASWTTRMSELEGERARLKQTLTRYGDTLAATHNQRALLEAVLDTAVQATRAHGGRLLLYDAARGAAVEQLRIGSARGLARRPAVGGRRRATASRARCSRRWSRAWRTPPRAIVSVPIVREDQLLGLVTVVDPEDGRFREDDVQTLAASPSRPRSRSRTRACTGWRTPGGHRRADRDRQPARVLRRARAGVRARPAVRPAALADHVRHRPLQAAPRRPRDT